MSIIAGNLTTAMGVFHAPCFDSHVGVMVIDEFNENNDLIKNAKKKYYSMESH